MQGSIRPAADLRFPASIPHTEAALLCSTVLGNLPPLPREPFVRKPRSSPEHRMLAQMHSSSHLPPDTPLGCREQDFYALGGETSGLCLGFTGIGSLIKRYGIHGLNVLPSSPTGNRRTPGGCRPCSVPLPSVARETAWRISWSGRFFCDLRLPDHAHSCAG